MICAACEILYGSSNREKYDGVGHVARMEETRSAYSDLGRETRGKDHLQDPGVDGTIILK